MIFPLFRRRMRSDTISSLYGTIVAQARLPSFYQDFAVDDTVNGRFELVVVHLVLVIERFSADPALQAQGQELFDHFCRDMDDNLREMGVGDLAVPKEMRRLGEAFYGRAEAYRSALTTAGPEALIAALIRNVYGGEPADPDAPHRLAAYMREAVGELAGQEPRYIAGGSLRFPAPATIAKVTQ